MTAREKLIEVMKARKWYGDTMNPGTARRFKRLVLTDGAITDDKIKEILMQLGHKPKTEETW